MANLRIQLKKKANPLTLNKVLKKMGLDYIFANAKENVAWLLDINTNPKSHQAHLKPENRDFTMDELKKCFSIHTKIGLLNADMSFGRCGDDEMIFLGNFIYENEKSIRYIRNAEDLIERGEIKGEKIIECLRRLDKRRQ